MFAARYKRDKGIDGPLTEDDWYKASDVFLTTSAATSPLHTALIPNHNHLCKTSAS